jgi:hypothetical protein
MPSAMSRNSCWLMLLVKPEGEREREGQRRVWGEERARGTEGEGERYLGWLSIAAGCAVSRDVHGSRLQCSCLYTTYHTNCSMPSVECGSHC